LTADELKSDEVQAAARQALALVDRRRNSMYATQLVRVVYGYRQVVAGMKYTLVLESGITDCRNTGEVVSLEACPIRTGAPLSRVVVQILDQPWVTGRYTLLKMDTDMEMANLMIVE
jgi:hypothetical protein